MIRFSWLLTRSLRDLISFKISSSLVSDFCGRNKSRVFVACMYTFWSQCCQLSLRNKHTATVMVSPMSKWTMSQYTFSPKATYNTGLYRWQDLGSWELTCFTSLITQRAVITGQNCKGTWAGPWAAGCIVAEVRLDAQQQAPRAAAETEGLWGREQVEQRLQITSWRLSAIRSAFKHIQFVCLTLREPTEVTAKWCSL